ncbi:nicotinate-nucleotide pyrophosphorylase (carboxylating) [Methylomarinovum caldicuralii]|uniref:Probable nicotinate-nucleotide pyrophosphorylase [carboxylating] n=1 Tax=Methylomarinovum caldicuralii TaxID=438856 RepID=A0AAU9C618_9GAMM|nr:carboxylating nicotinate-nucleotide diphosphorylase [Methylomarinovum caldicuralii]BCX82584.1 nicotinate-nucleotide pyrophosphorylase (carboxylating) [Methylomarinovum caldicuralii]
MIVDREQIRAWLAEDVGSGDLTAAIIPPERRARGRVVTREPMVLCGRDGFEAVFAEVDPACRIHWEAAEGEAVAADAVLCRLEGPARALLTAERTALNFLQTVSATATVTRRYAGAVAGTGAVVLDTRKTIPGLRRWQKYAVEVGGGVNHRMGLYDGILIKENHIAAAGSIAAAVRQARALETGLPVQVEVESLAELEEALAAGADMILLDNFSLEDLRTAVRLNAGRALLEASGNIGLDNIREVALTGVDRISVGALTKHVRAVDLSLRLTLAE